MGLVVGLLIVDRFAFRNRRPPSTTTSIVTVADTPNR